MPLAADPAGHRENGSLLVPDPGMERPVGFGLVRTRHRQREGGAESSIRAAGAFPGSRFLGAGFLLPVARAPVSRSLQHGSKARRRDDRFLVRPQAVQQGKEHLAGYIRVLGRLAVPWRSSADDRRCLVPTPCQKLTSLQHVTCSGIASGGRPQSLREKQEEVSWHAESFLASTTLMFGRPTRFGVCRTSSGRLQQAFRMPLFGRRPRRRARARSRS